MVTANVYKAGHRYYAGYLIKYRYIFSIDFTNVNELDHKTRPYATKQLHQLRLTGFGK